MLSHTPMKSLLPLYKDKQILALGSKDYAAVCRAYGFQHVVTVEDVLHAHPELYPFKTYHKRHDLHTDPFAGAWVEDMTLSVPHPCLYFLSAWGTIARHMYAIALPLLCPDALLLSLMLTCESFPSDTSSPLPAFHRGLTAVFILHDPVDWAPEIQVLCDVFEGGRLVGKDPADSGKHSHIPVYSSNSDLVFSSGYAVPRLAQGAFLTAWEAVYRACYGGKGIGRIRVGTESVASAGNRQE